MPTVGKLDKLIEIQKFVEINDSGDVKKTWQKVDDVWAEIISQKGSEAFESARTNARQTIRVRIRYRDDLEVSWRIVWDGQNYNVIARDATERRKGNLWFTAEVKAAV